MKRVALIVVLLAGAAAAQEWRPPPAKDGYAYPDCFCTNRGARVEMGETSCLNVDGKQFTAICAMSQNAPTWRRVGEGCPAPGLSLAPPASARPAPG